MDVVAGHARLRRVEDGQAQVAGDRLDQPAAIDVEAVFEAALHQQDAQIDRAQQQQQGDLAGRQGVVHDPPLQFQRHRREKGDGDRQDAEDDLSALAVLPDIGVECRWHVFPGSE